MLSLTEYTWEQQYNERGDITTPALSNTQRRTQPLSIQIELQKMAAQNKLN